MLALISRIEYGLAYMTVFPVLGSVAYSTLSEFTTLDCEYVSVMTLGLTDAEEEDIEETVLDDITTADEALEAELDPSAPDVRLVTYVTLRAELVDALCSAEDVIWEAITVEKPEEELGNAVYKEAEIEPELATEPVAALCTPEEIDSEETDAEETELPEALGVERSLENEPEEAGIEAELATGRLDTLWLIELCSEKIDADEPEDDLEAELESESGAELVVDAKAEIEVGAVPEGFTDCAVFGTEADALSVAPRVVTEYTLSKREDEAPPVADGPTETESEALSVSPVCDGVISAEDDADNPTEGEGDTSTEDEASTEYDAADDASIDEEAPAEGAEEEYRREIEDDPPISPAEQPAS